MVVASHSIAQTWKLSPQVLPSEAGDWLVLSQVQLLPAGVQTFASTLLA